MHLPAFLITLFPLLSSRKIHITAGGTLLDQAFFSDLYIAVELLECGTIGWYDDFRSMFVVSGLQHSTAQYEAHTW